MLIFHLAKMGSRGNLLSLPLAMPQLQHPLRRRLRWKHSCHDLQVAKAISLLSEEQSSVRRRSAKGFLLPLPSHRRLTRSNSASMSTITTMAVGNPACSLYREINNTIFLDQRPIRNLDKIRASGHDKLHDGLTHITRNSFESGFYADGNNTGTSLIYYFQPLTRRE
jgi:hypothetical protein